jgi:hypothetical protein
MNRWSRGSVIEPIIVSRRSRDSIIEPRIMNRLSRGENCRGVKLTTHLHLVPK